MAGADALICCSFQARTSSRCFPLLRLLYGGLLLLLLQGLLCSFRLDHHRSQYRRYNLGLHGGDGGDHQGCLLSISSRLLPRLLALLNRLLSHLLREVLCLSHALGSLCDTLELLPSCLLGALLGLLTRHFDLSHRLIGHLLFFLGQHRERRTASTETSVIVNLCRRPNAIGSHRLVESPCRLVTPFLLRPRHGHGFTLRLPHGLRLLCALPQHLIARSPRARRETFGLVDTLCRMLLEGLCFARQQFRPLTSLALHRGAVFRLGAFELLFLLCKQLAVLCRLLPVGMTAVAVVLLVGLHLLPSHVLQPPLLHIMYSMIRRDHEAVIVR